MTIDFQRRRGLGHDYIFNPVNKGAQGSITGWSTPKPSQGDFLILHNDTGGSRYRVDRVEWCGDPDDMWFADVSFVPRLRAIMCTCGHNDDQHGRDGKKVTGCKTPNCPCQRFEPDYESAA